MGPKGHGSVEPVNRENERDLLDFIAFSWRYRRLLLAGFVIGAVIGLGFGVLRPTLYTARVSLLPIAEKVPAGVFGQLASLAGDVAPSTANYEIVYEQIILSDAVLDSLAAREWSHVEYEKPVDLYKIFGIDRYRRARDPATMRRHRLMDRIRGEVVSFSRDKMTGFMELRVTVPDDPVFAAAFANELVKGLELFNRRVLIAKASGHRRFIEDRLGVVADSLRVARDAVVRFETENRSYNSTPELRARHQDLQREVEAQSAMWIELKRQVELARIEENRNENTLTILDRAKVPAERSGPGLPLYLLVGAFTGFFLAFAFIVIVTIAQPLRSRIRAGDHSPVAR
jgi:uncharacterized protein involved in exopolysaccharide biosynthesis